MLDEKYKIGIDFGGSHFGVIITNESGEVFSKSHINMDLSNIINQEEKEKIIIENIVPIIENCIEEGKVDRNLINFIGVGVPRFI